MSIIVYGPQGCGKTKNAEKLRKHFGMNEVCDDGHDPYPLTMKQVNEFKAGKTLFLTHIMPEYHMYSRHNRRVVSYEEVMANVKNGVQYQEPQDAQV